MHELIDTFGRKIDYLRVSVTDRCNLRCLYCMPAGGILRGDPSAILSFEEIYKIVKVGASVGICKIRITGGEPLVRKGLTSLISHLRSVRGISEIALTTNGTYLADHAAGLKEAGLDRINVSVDTLVPQRFREITRGGDLNTTLKGIEVALAHGFSSVKTNTVLIKNFNTDEILDIADLARTRPIHVRFIEYMPTQAPVFVQRDRFFSASMARDICSRLGKMEPLDPKAGNVAREFKVEGFRGTIGFIAPVSEAFCFACNKLRLTSDGRLRSCLHACHETDLKAAVRQGVSDEELAVLFKRAVVLKPASHHLETQPVGRDIGNFSMCQIGG